MESLRVSVIGKLIYYFFPYRKRVVLANIAQVFQDTLTPEQQRRLAQAFYTHLVTSIREMVSLRFMGEDRLRASVDIIGHEHLSSVAEAGKGVLVLTGHFGSWEYAPIGGILNFKAFQGRFHFIRRTLGAQWLEKILFRRYYQAGLGVIPKKNALNRVCDLLAENHAIVFVLDQHASLANRDGVAVEFFGKKAGTYRSLASIARHTEVPVVPASSYRRPDGRHVLEFHAPIPWQPHELTQEAIHQNTKAYNEALERMVLAHPEQWMWLHKRWKLST